MLAKKLIFICLTCFSLPIYAEEIFLSSEYQDEASGNPENVFGRGILLEIEERQKKYLFLATAAHVSSGENLTLSINTPIVGRLSDPLIDLEILELDGANAESQKLPRFYTPGLASGIILPQPGTKYSLAKIPLQEILGTPWLVGNIRPQQGQSGSGWVSQISLGAGHKLSHLGGIYIASERLRDRSYFVGARSVIALLKSYLLENKRGALHPIQWTMTNRLLHRKSPLVQEWPLGNSSGGRATKGDGSGFPKMVSTNVDLAAAIHQIRSGFHLPPDDELWRFDQNLRVAGEPILAFRENCPNGGDVWIAAEWESYFLQHGKISAGIPYQSIREGTELLPQMQARLKQRLKIRTSEHEIVTYRFVDKNSDFTLLINLSAQEMNFSLITKNGDSLTLEFDRYGRLPGASQFQALVMARGAISGQRYFIDLRDFFFVDASELIEQSDLGSPKETWQAAACRRKIESQTIRIRAERATRTAHLSQDQSD